MAYMVNGKDMIAAARNRKNSVAALGNQQTINTTTIQNILDNTDEEALNSIAEISREVSKNKTVIEALESLASQQTSNIATMKSEITGEIDGLKVQNGSIQQSLSQDIGALQDRLDAQKAQLEQADQNLRNDVTQDNLALDAKIELEKQTLNAKITTTTNDLKTELKTKQNEHAEHLQNIDEALFNAF